MLDTISLTIQILYMDVVLSLFSLIPSVVMCMAYFFSNRYCILLEKIVINSLCHYVFKAQYLEE